MGDGRIDYVLRSGRLRSIKYKYLMARCSLVHLYTRAVQML